MGLIPSLIALALMAPGQAKPPNPLPDPPPATYSYGVDGRIAVVVPTTHGEARADGGYIDVQAPASNSLSVAMSGTTAAFLCAGKISTALQDFQMVQDFEITCSDPAVRTVDVVLDSSLVGFVRSKHKGAAAVRFAEVSLTPCIPGAPPIGVSHPPTAVCGGQAKLINQHAPRVRGCAMPIGRFQLVARFRLESEASGFLDGHAVADFSPTTALPDTWVRARDPFQGVEKKSFGFTTVLAAEASPGAPATAEFRIRPVDEAVAIASSDRTPRPAKRPKAETPPSMPWKDSLTNPPTRR